VVAAVAEGFVMNARAKLSNPYKRVFNMAQLSTSAYFVGEIFHLLTLDDPSSFGQVPAAVGVFLLKVGCCSILYFVVNTGMVALAMALASRQSFLRLWSENFAWTWIPLSAGTSIAAFTFIWLGESAYILMAIGPTIVLIYFAYRTNLNRILQAQQHLKETENLLAEKTRAEQALQKAKAELEDRVAQRTAELTRTNLQLLKEVQDRRVAEEELAAEKDKLAVTLSSLEEGVITVDGEGRIILLNQTIERLTGWAISDGQGRTLGEILPSSSNRSGNLSKAWLDLLSRDPDEIANKGPYDFVSRDGRDLLLAVTVAPIRGAAGRQSGSVIVLRDVTEEKRTEEELLKAQKLQSVGLLAGGIAHDFNNILAGILLKSQMASRALTKGVPINTYLDSIIDATQNASRLTQQLLTFAKGGAPIKEAASIGELLQDSVQFGLRGSGVDSRFNIAEDLWNAEIDKGQISQVIHNLVINAEQAMPEGGTITVSAQNFTNGTAKGVPDLARGDYVMVTIADQGTGITPDHMARIFEPYFTTKPKGHGLGLATTYSIVKRHGGHIRVESEVGVGTTFTMYLPASVQAVAEPPPSIDEETRGSGYVLVMDDDELLLECAREILQDLGYQVAVAGDGVAACKLYQDASENGRAFDAVILDLTIRGGMGGKETMQRLLQYDPDVKAIVASGYSADPIMSNPTEYGFRAVLTKPFRVESVSSALQDAMQA
jgi:PAS domain S-box-containing protein